MRSGVGVRQDYPSMPVDSISRHRVVRTRALFAGNLLSDATRTPSNRPQNQGLGTGMDEMKFGPVAASPANTVFDASSQSFSPWSSGPARTEPSTRSSSVRAACAAHTEQGRKMLDLRTASAGRRRSLVVPNRQFEGKCAIIRSAGD